MAENTLPRRLQRPGFTDEPEEEEEERQEPTGARRLETPSWFQRGDQARDQQDGQALGQALGQAIGQSLFQRGARRQPIDGGGISDVPPTAFLPGGKEDGGVPPSAFIPDENTPPIERIREFGEQEAHEEALDGIPDRFTPEEFDQFFPQAGAIPDGVDEFSPEELASFDSKETSEAEIYAIAKDKIARNDLSLTRYEYEIFRKFEAERDFLDKTGGFFNEAGQAASQVAGDARLAAAAIADAMHIPIVGSDILEVRKDPNRRTSVREALASAGDAGLMWASQMGVIGRNTFDSVTGWAFEEIANIDKHTSEGSIMRTARLLLPKGLEIDEDTEIGREYDRLMRNMERWHELPQEGEGSLVGAYTAAAAGALGAPTDVQLEAKEKMDALVIEPLSNTLAFAPDFLLAFGATKAALMMRAVRPSGVSRSIVESAGAASAREAGRTPMASRSAPRSAPPLTPEEAANPFGATRAGSGAAGSALPWTLRMAQRIDKWALATASPAIDKGIRGVGSTPMAVITGTAGVVMSGGNPLAFLQGAAIPLATRGALYMGYGAMKWTGRSTREAAVPFARALKAKHEFGPAGKYNANMWARVAADTDAPAWARTTAGVSNLMLNNSKMRQIISDTKTAAMGGAVGGVTEGLQEAFEEAVQTGSTPESIGAGAGAGATVGKGFGVLAGSIYGPKDIDALFEDMDALHFRERMIARGDDPHYFDNVLTQQDRRDIAAAQAAAIDSADVRLVNDTVFSAELGRPGMRRLAEGVYRGSNGEILINTDVIKPERIARVVAHEIGHAAFDRLPQDQKDQWQVIADRTYGQEVIEKYHADLAKDREHLGDVSRAEVYDELYAEHFLGMNSTGRKLLDRKRQISGDFGAGRTMRRINDSVLAMMGIDGAVERGKDVKGRMLFDSTPYKADPAMEKFIHNSLRDLGNKFQPPPLPDPFETNPLTERETGVVGDAVRARSGSSSVVELDNGKHVVILDQQADGSLNVIDLDQFEQALRDLPPDGTRSHRARVASALEQAKTGRRDSDPAVAALVDSLIRRPEPAPPEVAPPLPESAPPLTPEEAADPFGTQEEGSQLGDAELSSLFENLNQPVETLVDPLTSEQRDAQRRREEFDRFREEAEKPFLPKKVEKPEISSIVENAQPSQLKGARPPGDQRYAPRRRTVEPSAIRSIAGRTLSEAGAASGTSTTNESASPEAVAFTQLNAIKSAAPILSARNQRKARLAIEGGRGGQEHKVLIEPGNEWVTKTWDSYFNSDIDTPLDYLKRIGLQNGLFGDNIQVLGIYDGTNIVTRQPFYDADDTTIQPSESEIRGYMAERGFRLVDSASSAFSNGNIVVSDARPANFVRRRDTGELQLIDAMITEERPARAEPDQFEDVVDDVDSTERFEEEVSDLIGDRFAPLPPEVEFEFTRDSESGGDNTIITSNGVPVEGRSSSDFVVYDGQAYMSTGLDSGAKQIAGKRFKTDPNQLEVHRVEGIIIPNELKGQGIGQALYLSHFQNVDAADAKPTYFYNSQQSAEALAATLALERKGLLNYMPLSREGARPTPGQAGGPYLAWLTDSGRTTDPKTLQKREGSESESRTEESERGFLVDELVKSLGEESLAQIEASPWKVSAYLMARDGGSRADVVSTLEGPRANSGDRFAPGKFPRAADTVDGRTVREEIPNQDSIEASLTDFEVLPGIREVRIDQFSGAGSSSFVTVRDHQQVDRLAQEIRESGEISPLIVVDDGHPDGPYILEGAHRFEALEKIGAKSFPALVVRDLASDQTADTVGDARPDRFAPAQDPGRTPGVLPSDRAEAGGLRGRGRVGRGTAGVQEPYRPYPPSNERPLSNLASTVKVDGRKVEFGPLPVAREAARSYMRQAGLPYHPPTDYVRVDKERATRIADEFERMEHAPNDPEVQAAYRAMVDETLAQYDAIKATGLVVEPIPFGAPDPYGNPRNAILDVVENNHMWFFPTQAGFGGPASTSVDISGNPLLEPTGETINGHEMVANDVFRVVHDYFGHIKEGLGFRADGEENAWRSHSSMYSDLARRAMTVETRGQNSWVNFGPFGEQNRTANGADTEYAPQKIGLLPEWVVEEGRGGGIVEDASPTPTEPALGASLSEAAGTGGLWSTTAPPRTPRP